MDPKKDVKKPDNLIEEEEKVTGQVTFADYRNYLKYSMGMCGCVIYIVICSIAAMTHLSLSLRLADWSTQSFEEQQKSFYPNTLAALIGINFVVALAREFTVFNILIRSTTNMHKAMAQTIVRAKVVFFDSNPIGRILTRFSKDMAVLDLILPTATVLCSYGVFRTVSVTIALTIINYWLLIPIFFICIYFAYVVRLAARPMIEAQRLDSVVRGPIHSLFAMVLNGMISIRAYDQLDFFKAQFMNEAELSANVTFTYILTNRWLGFRMDFGIMALSLIASLFCILLKDSVDPQLLAFSLQTITDFTIYFSISVRMATEM